MNEIVEKAKDAYEEAAKGYCAAVKEAYPVGKYLHVELGGNVLQVEVTAHSVAWWSRPGEINGVNTDTGKVRRFHPDNVLSA